MKEFDYDQFVIDYLPIAALRGAESFDIEASKASESLKERLKNEGYTVTEGADKCVVTWENFDFKKLNYKISVNGGREWDIVINNEVK